MVSDPIEHLIQIIPGSHGPGFDPSCGNDVVQDCLPRGIQSSDGLAKVRDDCVKAVVLESCCGKARPNQRGLPVEITAVHVRSCVYESLDCLQPGHTGCEVQCCVTLFIQEDIVVHLSGIIGRVLAQEFENCSIIIGPVDKVNDGDLSRVREGCAEVRKLLCGDPSIKPRVMGLKSCRRID